MKNKKSKWGLSRLNTLFFGSLMGVMITILIVVIFDFKPFSNHILNIYWVQILWLIVLYSVILPMMLFPKCKWSKWWSK